MPAPGYQDYARALRVLIKSRIGEYDEETVMAFIADLFRREYNDVQRDLEWLRKPRVR